MSADLPDLPDDDDTLAAEYVLRLLDPESERAVARRVVEDAAFAALVHDWEATLAATADELDPVAPPSRLRARLMDGIAEGDSSARPSRTRRWWLGAGLGLAALTAALVLYPRSVARDPEFTAILASAEEDLQLSASVTRDALRVARVSGGARPDRVLELWLIAEGADAPVSLGVLPDTEIAEIALSSDLVAQIPGGTLAVSDEPPGGSPTGAPTGDILAAAPLVVL